MITEGYKIISASRKSFLYGRLSKDRYLVDDRSLADLIRDGYILDYPVGKWVEPKVEGSKLFFYPTYEDACHPIRHIMNEGYRIVRCRVRGVFNKRLVVRYSDIGSSNFSEFWDGKILGIKKTKMPHKGKCASAIMCLE